MSKYTFVGGDIIENIGGDDLSYARGNIINIGSEVIRTTKEGIFYKEPELPPYFEDIIHGVVFFEPTNNYQGEFGFDWLSKRGKVRDIDYVIPKDDKTTQEEALSQLKRGYHTIDILCKKTEITGKKYYIPYLTLFSKEFVESLLKTENNIQPVYEAELNVFFYADDWKEMGIRMDHIDGFELEYDKKYFTITPSKLQDYSSTGHIAPSNHKTIKISCLKDFADSQEIKVYCNPGTLTGADKPLERTLAGVILVLPNDKSHRKEMDINLVKVESNVNNIENYDIARETGKFYPKEVDSLHRFLHQALIIPIIKEDTLDLSNDENFKINKNNFINEDGFFVIKHITEGLDYLNSVYANKDAVNLFALGIESEDREQGIAKIGRYIAIVFPVENRLTSVLVHETLHSLGLTHTHYDSVEYEKDEEIKELILSNRKQIYKKYTTNNVMAYVQEYKTPKNMVTYKDPRVSLWYWQWKIINSQLW